MYIFIDENTIEAYKNEILKRYVGNRLIKTISNPTDEDLLEFGYKYLVDTEVPEYNQETQHLTEHYEVQGDNIVKTYIVNDIPTEDEVSEIEDVGEEV